MELLRTALSFTENSDLYNFIIDHPKAKISDWKLLSLKLKQYCLNLSFVSSKKKKKIDDNKMQRKFMNPFSTTGLQNYSSFCLIYLGKEAIKKLGLSTHLPNT